ncbi:MAG TPA: putative aminohydrolase SsnA [Elusimicrobiota bacterium]|nr:putative aminohydrolase SsnA [Elusimicrobiota bacterium]
MASGTLLIENGTVWTAGKTPRVIRDGAVLIEDGVIRSVGPASVLRKKARSAPTLSADGKLVMPGFVCAHHHLYSTFARGMASPGFRPRNFLEILKGLWWKLDKTLTPEDVYWSSLSVLAEALRCGTTTVIDHHESQGAQEGVLDHIAKAVERVGMRASLTLGVSDRYGKGREGLRENERFLRKLRGSKNDLVSGMVGLHASFTVNDDTLEGCADLSRRFDAGVHVHVAEDAMDESHSVRRYGRRIVHRFDRAGILSPKTILVHCVHVDRSEREILKRTGTNVVHNPESNMNNAVGAADILALVRHGVRVGLGTDGMSSHMPLQARAAYLLQRHVHRDPAVGFAEAVRMLIETNPGIVRRVTGTRVGELTAGAAGDVIVVDYDPPTPLAPGNFGGHLMFGVPYRPVRSAVIGGRVRLRAGRLAGTDEQEIFRRSREAAERFWKRMR